MDSSEYRIRLENQMKGGLIWFYWIAGLSFINLIIFILGSNINFADELGITQVINVIFQENILAIIWIISGYLAKLKLDSLMKNTKVSNIEQKII